MRRGLPSGFTLIELLVVLAIIVIAAGLTLNVTTTDKRLADVSAAANELAATMRDARARAMERQAIHAVVFHVQNGVGTSGRLINNWDGEHWYRLAGPSFASNLPGAPDPTRLNTTFAVGYNVVKAVRDVARSWVGDPHRLAARKVRFLALTDQDNGHAHSWWDDVTAGGSYARFPATYPRPWCGWWDATTQRLHPWGGYDTTMVDGEGRHNAGFYYEGNDGTITECRTPAGRTRTSTLTVTEMGNEVVADQALVLLAANAPRPLINGNWLDVRIVFYPDGHVTMPGVMDLRYESRATRGGGGGNAVAGFGDLGDLYPGWRSWSTGTPSVACERPATSFQAASGYWWITLAPDIPTDTDVYPTVQDAVRSMRPCYRVGINGIGDVQVVQVGTALATALPDGTPIHLDSSITDWSSSVQTKANYANNMLSYPNTERIRGRPVSDALVPAMLTARSWWYSP